MDKLTIEEKAKRYDEVIGRVVNIKTGKCETTFIFTEGLFDYLFPELEECNEEGVREAMIDFFKHEREEGVVVSHYGVNIERMIAWLEKQGQVNETIISQHEDKICKENNDSLTSEDERIKKYLLSMFSDPNDSWDGISAREIIAWLEKQGEPTDINPSEFDLRLNKLLKQFETLPKEELASSLSFYLNVVQNDGTYREEKQGEQKPQRMISAEAKEAMYGNPAWSEEDERVLNATINTVLIGRDSCEEDDEVRDRYDDELKWLKSLKSRIGYEANCTTTIEWSEEDEATVKDICDKLNRLSMMNVGNLSVVCQEDIKWLKSLKERIGG